MIAISAVMPSMQEEVQKRAEEQQEVREHAECVGGVLGHQVERRDGQENHQRQAGS